jgi:serine/threonine-protein kinase
MSPEQMASARDVDARTDIWDLGVIVYELLVGRPPFDAESITQLCAMVLQQEAERPRARRPELPAAVDEIVARCLRKSPAERYATVGELAVALAELAPKHARASVKRITGVLRSAGLGTATALPPSSDEMPPNASIQRGASTAVSWGETAPAVPKRSLLPLLAGAGILALIGLGGLLYVLRGGSSVSEQAASAASAVAESAASAGAAPLATLEPSIAPPPEPSASSSAPAPAVSVSALGTCVVASVQLVQIEPRDGGAARGYAGKDHRHSKLRRPAHGFFTGSWRSGLRRLPRDPSARVRHGTTR